MPDAEESRGSHFNCWGIARTFHGEGTIRPLRWVTRHRTVKVFTLVSWVEGNGYAIHVLDSHWEVVETTSLAWARRRQPDCGCEEIGVEIWAHCWWTKANPFWGMDP